MCFYLYVLLCMCFDIFLLCYDYVLLYLCFVMFMFSHAYVMLCYGWCVSVIVLLGIVSLCIVC